MENVNVETLDEVTSDDVAGWTVDVLERIDAELAADEALLKARRDVFRRGVVAKYGKNTVGTISTQDGAIQVKVETPKLVDWDQAKLADLWQEIGNDAGEYISVKYGVSESKYKAWPAVIRAAFEPARTVRPGSPKVTFVRKAVA